MWCLLPVIPEPEKWRQIDQPESKTILGYIVSSRTVSVTKEDHIHVVLGLSSALDQRFLMGPSSSGMPSE